MQDVLAAIDRWAAKGQRAALATLVGARRSAPRPLGSRLAVSESGELAGSISGGCVEAEVAELAREVIASGKAQRVSYGIDDETAWGVGLPCGGEIDVIVAPAAGDAEALRAALEAIGRGERAQLLTGERGELTLLRADGSRVGAAPAPDALSTELGPPVHVIVVGGVDIAEHLCAAAKGLGWRTTVTDPRPALASRARLPSADELVVAWPDEALEQIGLDEATAVVVLTHDEKLDVPALRTALASDAFYVGALGSRRTQARRRERLEDEVGEAALERLAGPCGLDLGAADPRETALSILAEIVARRHGREGGSLSSAVGPIHART